MDADGGEGCAGDEGGGVGADAEEGDVAEVEEAGEADDDVEAECDGGEDEDVRADEGVFRGVLGEGEAEGCDQGCGEGDVAVLRGQRGDAGDEAYRVSAVKVKPAVMRKPMNCSDSSVGMSIP